MLRSEQAADRGAVGGEVEGPAGVGSEVAARPRVLIVGAGFGGLACARALAAAPVEVTLVDRRNYHLFQPLLYQVATAALSPADVAWPIRSILRHQKNAHVRLGRVVGVDAPARVALTEDGGRLAYDFLVLATGVRHSYFGRDDWEEAAPGLKKIDDATLIRQRLLVAFERAETAEDPDERRSLLTFVVVGGGPTGVEMAGAIAELAHHSLAMDFRRIDPKDTRVVLVESGKRPLASFPEDLSAKAAASLRRLGVELRFGAPVTACDADGVIVAGERIAARTVVWAAGVMASPAGKWLGVATDRAGRLIAQPDLSVPGHPEIFAIGDTAAVTAADGGAPVPGIAPAAKQMGDYVGRLIARRVAGGSDDRPFRYRHAGNLATIGRNAAVVHMGPVRLAGFAAWLLWAVAHIYFLIGWRHRFLVAHNWFWSYLTFERGARLITGASSESGDAPPGPAGERIARAA